MERNAEEGIDRSDVYRLRVRIPKNDIGFLAIEAADLAVFYLLRSDQDAIASRAFGF